MQVKPPLSTLLQPISFMKTLFLTSCLPFSVGILCEGIICLVSCMNDSFPINKDLHDLESKENLLLLFIKGAQGFSYGVYSSCLRFLSAIIFINLINIIIRRLKITLNHDLKKEKTASGANSSLRKISLILLRIFGYAFAYIVFYYIYSLIIGTRIQEANSLSFGNDKYLNENLSEIEAPLRMLIEEDNTHDQLIRDDKKNYTTFPLGRVLGSLNIDASSIVFSKDETLLFASRANVFQIVMVDISDWENPVILQEKMIINMQNRENISLALSPDGKTLFASNMDFFAVIEFDSNSMKFFLPSVSAELPKNLNVKFETHLAPLPDGKKVLVSGYGLQIYDVSKRRDAKLVKYELPFEEFNPSAVAVFGQSLFLLNGNRIDIYNTTDLPDNRKLISSFESQNTLSSFIQSKDGRRLTLIGFQKGTHKVVIERVDVSDVTAVKLIETFDLNVESFSSLFALNQSPKETYLYFTVANEASETQLLVFDTFTEKLLEDSQNMISKAKSLLFTSSEDHAMAVFQDSILALQLFRHSPNDRIFTITKETFAQVPTFLNSSNQILQLFSSPSGRFLLNIGELNNSDFGSRFTFTDISDKSLPIEVSSFSAASNPVSVRISNDAKILNAIFQSRIISYDISNIKSVNILGSYAFEKSVKILDAVFTLDGKTCYAMISTGTAPRLKVFDLSNSASIQEIDSFSHYSFLGASPYTQLLLSKDEKNIFIIGEYLYRFDVSARKVAKDKTFSQNIDNSKFLSQSVFLSPDGRILAIKRDDLRSPKVLFFNVSNNLDKLSSFVLPKNKVLKKKIQVGFSPDSQYAYVEGVHGGQPSLLVLNISDPSTVIFQSVIQAEGFTQGSVDNFIISDDGKTTFLASDSENKIYIANVETSNSLFLGTESFRLGEKSFAEVMILRKNNHGDYVPLGKDCKFLKTSLFSTKIIPTEYSTESKFALLPYWMTFQKESGTLVIEPKKQSDLKTYTLYTAFSTQLSQNSFKSIYSDPGQIQAVISGLMTIGYLDTDLYVTGNLGSLDNFYLATPDNEKIYRVLKQNYFETFTMFDVVPSLEVAVMSSKRKIQVETPSENLLKVEISFGDAVGVQFLKKKYGPLEPLITENKTKLVMEGSFEDVNDALEKLVVNFEERKQEYEGVITIWDHLNPSINKTLKNLSSYFEANQPPMVNPKEGYAVQSQIDSRAIYTGEYFSLILFNNTFIDKHSAETLRFTLTSDNKERSSAPSWLTFNDLILKGTPPEEVLHRSINLVLTVQNEFKKIEVPITLNVRLSATFILKLLVKNSPYILTVLGLWVYANRIYNVVRKSKYRHHQDFYISVGKEITAQDIYPIRFLGQEGQESELIWKHLMKKKKGNKRDWNKSQIIEEIKNIAEKLPKKNLNLYHNGSDLSQKLIHQLIMNNLVLCLIDSKEEKETKRVYEENVQGQLVDFVKWENDGHCKINESKLAEILKKNLNHGGDGEGMDIRLMNDPINVNLLKNVMIAEAMNCQNISIRKLFAHLIIKEEVEGNRLKKFLKRNLCDLQIAREGLNTVYGINYEVKNGVLHFSGAAEEMFCGKTIVLQIVDLRQKILKEVWIHGVKNNDDARSKVEAERSHYEVL